MATIDSAPEGGKFRAYAAAGLDATAGAWGDGNLLCVSIDASGTLALGTASACDGVIVTTEGKRDSTAAGYKNVVGGNPYTVLRFAEMVELDGWASPAAAVGDVFYAAASGDVTTTASDEATVVGKVVQGDGTTGMKFVLDVGGSMPSGILSAGDLTVTIIAGGSAGAHTVTGIATTDTLIGVIEMDFTDASETGADLLSEFSITGANTIDNTAGTDTTGGFLLVFYAS